MNEPTNGYAADPYLPHQATVEARNVLADWLVSLAEDEAKGSRDFGRGFMHAIATLRNAPVQCHSCTPRRAVGETVACPDCGSLWRVAQYGMSWVPGGQPTASAGAHAHG